MGLPNVEDVKNDLLKLVELQKVVTELKKTTFKKYVTDRKLHLIDSKFEIIDKLLKEGILK